MDAHQATVALEENFCSPFFQEADDSESCFWMAPRGGHRTICFFLNGQKRKVADFDRTQDGPFTDTQTHAASRVCVCVSSGVYTRLFWTVKKHIAAHFIS